MLLLIACFLTSNTAYAVKPVAYEQGAPVYVLDASKLSDNGYMGEWISLGPILTDKIPLKDVRGILDPVNGEVGPMINEGMNFSYTDFKQVQHTITAQKLSFDFMIDLGSVYQSEYVYAYMFSWVKSDAATTLTSHIIADDGVTIWINGKQVPIQGNLDAFFGQTYVDLPFEAGLNRLLIRLEQITGPWQLTLEILTKEQSQKRQIEEEKIRNLTTFQNMSLVPVEGAVTNYLSYLINAGGSFPTFKWQDSEFVHDLFGKFPLTVQWYDANGDPVTSPQTPGVYDAYITAELPDGSKFRRIESVFARPDDFHPWEAETRLSEIKLPGINQERLNEFLDYTKQYQDGSISDAVQGMFVNALFRTPQGVEFLNGFYGREPLHRAPTQLDSPAMLTQDRVLKLKLKVMDIDPTPTLKPPTKRSIPAPVLHSGTLDEAGIKPGTVEKLRAVFKEWNETSGKPFTVLLARHGVIFMHEGFSQDGSANDESVYPMASITKNVSGLLFGRFIDQGLISVTDPVGKFLPDFAIEGSKMLTLKNCLSHTSGLEGHGEYGGMRNPYLENVIANAPQKIKPNCPFLYNGMGFDLAGKVMEIVGHKSIFRLFHEDLFQPLGISPKTTIVDLAYGITWRAMDLAHIAQLILNKGSYGDLEFMSPESFAYVAPSPTGDYGLGMSMMNVMDPNDPKRFIISEMIGHGAASSSMLYVSPTRDLLITMGRITAGDRYDEYVKKFLLVLEEGLVD